MSQKPETVFRARIRKALDMLPNSWFESIQQKAIQGTPDIIGCVNGIFVGLELKATPSGKASALQQLKLDRINAAGGIAHVLHPDNAETILENLYQIATGEKND